MMLRKSAHNPPHTHAHKFLRHLKSRSVDVFGRFQGGATDSCKENLKAAWPKILAAAADPEKRQRLQADFMTCGPVSENGGQGIISWASSPWGMMAMGNCKPQFLLCRPCSRLKSIDTISLCPNA